VGLIVKCVDVILLAGVASEGFCVGMFLWFAKVCVLAVFVLCVCIGFE